MESALAVGVTNNQTMLYIRYRHKQQARQTLTLMKRHVINRIQTNRLTIKSIVKSLISNKLIRLFVLESQNSLDLGCFLPRLCTMLTTRTPQLLDEGGEDRRSLSDCSPKYFRAVDIASPLKNYRYLCSDFSGFVLFHA